MAEDYFLYAVALMYGLVVGSFMNVCIFRIPEKRSIVNPPSACMNCGNRLKPYHNIPVFSYLALGGKCAFCGTKISIQYPLVELANGLLYVLALYVFGPTPAAAGAMFVVSAFFVGMMVSFERSSVPLSVAVFTAAISIPAGVLCFGMGYPDVLAGMAAGAAVAGLSGFIAKQPDIVPLMLLGGAAGAVCGLYGAATICLVACIAWLLMSVVARSWDTRLMMSGFVCMAAIAVVFLNASGGIEGLLVRL